MEAGLAMHFRNEAIYTGVLSDLRFNIWLDNKYLD